MERTPEKIRKLNELLRADLGSNPRYSWRWSDDLLHVMDVVDSEGKPIYSESTTPAGLIVMAPKRITRPLLPFHEHCWVLCALVETTQQDGELAGTGLGSWIPVGGGNGPVTLLPFEAPNLESTQYIVNMVRQARTKTVVEMGIEWNEQMAKREKDRWSQAYEQIKEHATAYYNVPGSKGHVSFPSYAYGDANS